MTNKTICFTGHRIIATKDRPKLFRFLDSFLHECVRSGYNTFRVGGALGFDTEVAEMLLRMRQEEGLTLRLEMVLPCRDQDARWKPADRRRYQEILAKADSMEYVCDTYRDGCMQERNRVMVDKSDVCLAYCRRPRSGTYGTMRYAKEKGLVVINLAERIDALPE